MFFITLYRKIYVVPNQYYINNETIFFNWEVDEISGKGEMTIE